MSALSGMVIGHCILLTHPQRPLVTSCDGTAVWCGHWTLPMVRPLRLTSSLFFRGHYSCTLDCHNHLVGVVLSSSLRLQQFPRPRLHHRHSAFCHRLNADPPYRTDVPLRWPPSCVPLPLRVMIILPLLNALCFRHHPIYVYFRVGSN